MTVFERCVRFNGIVAYCVLALYVLRTTLTPPEYCVPKGGVSPSYMHNIIYLKRFFKTGTGVRQIDRYAHKEHKAKSIRFTLTLREYPSNCTIVETHRLLLKEISEFTGNRRVVTIENWLRLVPVFLYTDNKVTGAGNFLGKFPFILPILFHGI